MSKSLNHNDNDTELSNTSSNTVLNNQPLVPDPIIISNGKDQPIQELQKSNYANEETDAEENNSNQSTPLALPTSLNYDKNKSTNDNNSLNNQTNEFSSSSISLDSFSLNNESYKHDFGNISTFNKIKLFIINFKNNWILPNVGISLLLFSQFLNSIMVTTCKLLVTDKDFNKPIHPLQILFVRMFITYICCLLYMFITKSVPEAPLGPKPIRKLLIMRGLVGFFGVFGMYYSLQYLSLSDAVAITFLIPMVTAFLAFCILKEKYSILEAICSIFSLGGVVLIAKPSFIFGSISDNETNSIDESIESASTEKRIIATVVGLIGVCGASCVYIVLRKIGMNAHPLLSVSYFALICCIVTFITILILPGLSFILPSNSYQWFLFFIIGFSGFFMQFSLTAGIQRVKASRASLMAYSGMVFAIIWDLTIWHHTPGLLSFLGIFLIIGNAIVILKFKPEKISSSNVKEQDLENNGKYNELNDDSSSIALEEFIITDDDDDGDKDGDKDDDQNNGHRS
ncbi:unnamed protein product [Candida verbasci]|uniref:EamA domain-containing protein n=1 Tax=Candida verbasci TaxID=1227364 RepID=A0A9W4TV55_9ASCO|nr:unnamed protein product [Candida verbasci]